MAATSSVPLPQLPVEQSYLSVVSLCLFQQGSESCEAVAHVPFDFSVGDASFRSGRYVLGPGEVAGTFFIRADGASNANMLVQAVYVPRQGNGIWRKLLFYRRAGRYALAQILVAAD
jgi:hypothetical protein